MTPIQLHDHIANLEKENKQLRQLLKHYIMLVEVRESATFLESSIPDSWGHHKFTQEEWDELRSIADEARKEE